MTKKALGKGLSALIPQTRIPAGKGVTMVEVDKIHPNPYQPRTSFNPLQLKELAESIRENGIVQPLVVRPRGEGYELIAGERRWRALKMANVSQVPAIIKDVSDSQSLEISLVENIQREDLNPLAQALAYQQLQQGFAYDQQKIARVVGKDRSTVVNFLRLLKLPSQIQEHLKAERITMGHARALLSLPTAAAQIGLCQRVINQKLSVRQTEILVGRKQRRPKRSRLATHDIHREQIEARLREHLGTKVRIIAQGQRGRIVIEYYNPRDRERILAIISGSSNAVRQTHHHLGRSAG
jgi:ParB family chromosome partitioning protein